jgi:HD-GYP domain-containing protein (c-di-GMP phosphodiesterase class II)
VDFTRTSDTIHSVGAEEHAVSTSDLTSLAERDPAFGSVDDELTREARTRREQGRVERRTYWIFLTIACIFVVTAVATTVFLKQGPHFSWPTALLFVLLYAIGSRVLFEIGTGSVLPTQLIFVPMLFALPVGLVPGLVAIGKVAGALAKRGSPVSVNRVILPLANSVQTVGPTLVLALGGGLPLRWSAWPIYIAALAAQFAVDSASVGVILYGYGEHWRTFARSMGLVVVVDGALAPIGLAIAFATRGHATLVVGVLPLMFLLRHFSLERQRRIDNALELSDAYRGTAFLLGDVVEADDHYTGAHSRHVVELVVAVSKQLGLGPTDQRDAEFVALLHDVGKIRIPPEIINKPGPLDATERALIETHTIEGERMLEQVGGLLGHVGRLVRSCHEHWDGKGYPDGLAGDAIPLVARIVSTCDAFSAMTTDRSYRRGFSHEEALAELRRCAGTQFDPRVVDALVLVVS